MPKARQAGDIRAAPRYRRDIRPPPEFGGDLVSMTALSGTDMTDGDKLREECGVFGVTGPADASNSSRSDCMRCSTAARRPPASSRMIPSAGSTGRADSDTSATTSPATA